MTEIESRLGAAASVGSQYITVTFTGVMDSQNNIGNVSGTMGVLIGDVNANGAD